MESTEKKDGLDAALIYSIAAERFNVIHQQSQAAISISTVSVMAFGAAIGAIFASMANARAVYRFYADLFIILVAVVAIVTSFVCKEILDRTVEVVRRYEDKLKVFECQNELVFKPHTEFNNIWKQLFKEYEPYKMTSWLMIFAMVMYAVFIIAAVVNILYLMVVIKIKLW